MPVCSRCAGVYIAFLVSLVGLVVLDWNIKEKFVSHKRLLVMLFFLLLMAADVALTTLGVYEPINLVRFFTGFMFGWFLPLVLLPVKNSVMFRLSKATAYLAHKPRFLLWIGLGLSTMVIFYFTGYPLIRLWSVVAVGGILAFMANLVLILFFSLCGRCQGRIKQGWPQAGIYIFAGMAAAVVLSGLAVIRPWLLS